MSGLNEQEREALDRASSVLGWQHLQKFSGQSREWMDTTLMAIVRAALAARTEQARPEHAAVTFGSEVQRRLDEALEDGAEGEELRYRMLAEVETMLTCHFCGEPGLPPCCQDDEDANRADALEVQP